MECSEASSYWVVDFPEKSDFQQKVIILLSVKVLDMAYFDQKGVTRCPKCLWLC